MKGIIPRTFEYLFNKIKFIENEEQNIKVDINIAYIQIYLETIQDLFCPKTIIKIREDSKKGLFLDGCLWIPVKNEKECKEAFERGEKNRITEYNKINEYTLRSHTILLINIEKYYENDIATKGILYLVNLAGSERVGKYYTNSNKIEQAKKINKSLSVLGNCIQNLVSGKKYIPYRESNLTRILQESLNGNSKTSLIITISPSNINSEETYSSLNFGTRALKVKINPQKNISNNDQNPIKILRQKYNELYNKYIELSLKYEKENEYAYEDVEDEESEIKNKIIEENITELKKKNLLLNEKEEIINNLKNQLDEANNKYKICSLENDKLNKTITYLNNLIKANKIDFEKETKEFLEKQNFEVDEINNNKINYILKQLIKDINQKDILINNLKKQTDLLNNILEEIKNKYEDKYNLLEQEKKKTLKEKESLEKEIIKLKSINSIHLEKINIMEEQMFKLEKFQNEKVNMEAELRSLITSIKKLNEKNEELKTTNSKLKKNNNKYQEEIKNINEKHKEEIKNIDDKYQEQIKKLYSHVYPNLKEHSYKDENARLISTININEKILSNSLNLMTKDIELFNKIKKEFRGIEAIIDNDIPPSIDNNYPIIMRKSETKIYKIEDILNSIDININEKNSLKNDENEENIYKINGFIEEYKEIIINAYTFVNKLFKKIVDLGKINKKIKDAQKSIYESQKKEDSKVELKEKIVKQEIISVILNNIEKFRPICYYTDNSDLKNELILVNNQCDNLPTFEVLKKGTNILQKIILRSAEYRRHKEEEIKNLNNKINYFLREIENYKKYYNNHKTSDLDEEKRLLNNQLFLQDGEINRLHKEIEKLINRMSVEEKENFQYN